MNKRGLLKMLGLAPIVPVAAAMPVATIGSGTLITNIEDRLGHFKTLHAAKEWSVDEQVRRHFTPRMSIPVKIGRPDA